MPFGKTWGGLLNDAANVAWDRTFSPVKTVRGDMARAQKAAQGFGNMVQGAVDKATPYAMEGAMRGFGATPEIMDFYDKKVSQYNPVEDAMGGRMEYKAPPQNLAQSQNPFSISAEDAQAIAGLGGQKESFGPSGDMGAVAPSDTPDPVDLAQFEEPDDTGIAPIQKMQEPERPAPSGIDINKVLGGLALPDSGSVGGKVSDGRLTRDQLLKMAGIETDSARDARIAKSNERPDLNAGGKTFKNPEEQGISAADQMRRYQAIANDPAFIGTPQRAAAKDALASADLRTRVANEQADAASKAKGEEDTLKRREAEGRIGAQEDAAKMAKLEQELKKLDLALRYETDPAKIQSLKAEALQKVADAKVASETAGERIRGEKLKNENITEDNRGKASDRDRKEREFAETKRMNEEQIANKKQKDFQEFSKGFTSEFGNLEKESREMLQQGIKDNPTDRANIEKQVNDYRAQKYGSLLKQKAAEAQTLGLKPEQVKPFLEQELRKIPGFSPSLMKQLMSGLGQGAQVLGSARALVMPGANF